MSTQVCEIKIVCKLPEFLYGHPRPKTYNKIVLYLCNYLFEGSGSDLVKFQLIKRDNAQADLIKTDSSNYAYFPNSYCTFAAGILYQNNGISDRRNRQFL